MHAQQRRVKILILYTIVYDSIENDRERLNRSDNRRVDGRLRLKKNNNK